MPPCDNFLNVKSQSTFLEDTLNGIYKSISQWTQLNLSEGKMNKMAKFKNVQSQPSLDSYLVIGEKKMSPILRYILILRCLNMKFGD